MDMGRGEERGRSNMETLHYVKERAKGREFDVWLRKQGLCINLEGWDREGDRREVQKGGNICMPTADSC